MTDDLRQAIMLPACASTSLPTHTSPVTCEMTMKTSQWVAQDWVQESGKRDRSVVFVLSGAQNAPAPEAPATNEESATCPASL